MKKFSLRLTSVCVASLVLLIGCGGGSSGSEDESVLGKYVGTWIDKCTVISPGGGSDGPISEHQIFTITQLDDTRLSAAFQGPRYSSVDCSGTGIPSGESTSILTYVGSKSVPQGTADMFQVAKSGSAPRNNISMIKDGQFYPVGDPDQMAADGFPSNVVLEYVFRKR